MGGRGTAALLESAALCSGGGAVRGVGKGAAARRRRCRREGERSAVWEGFGGWCCEGEEGKEQRLYRKEGGNEGWFGLGLSPG